MHWSGGLESFVRCWFRRLQLNLPFLLPILELMMTSLARYLNGCAHQLLGDYNSFGDRMGIGPMLNSIRYPQKSVLWSGYILWVSNLALITRSTGDLIR